MNLAFPEQTVTALIGPSGCGKSTFLRSLNRMNDEIASSSTTGHIWMDGQDLTAPETDVIKLRQQIGMVWQRPNPFTNPFTIISPSVPNTVGCAKETA